MSSTSDRPELPCLHRDRVHAEWIDYNGHMNVAYYVLAFDHATDALLDHLGMDAAYRHASNATTYVLETHVSYLRELRQDAPFRVTVQLLDHDAKRLHYFQEMRHEDEGFVAASTEIMLIHIDAAATKAAPFPPEILARVATLGAAHAGLARPRHAGRTIGIRR